MRRAADQSKALFGLILFGFFTVFILTALLASPAAVQAEELQNRSVNLSSYHPSTNASYFFSFYVPTTSTIGSIVFNFCDNSPVFSQPCNPPTGLDVSSANLTAQTGNTGFTVDTVDSTANLLIINRVPLAGSIITTTYNFTNITNPSTAGSTVYIRIATFSNNNGSGNINDTGAVAFVTAPQFQVNAFVPPYLRLCVGVTVAPDCSSLSGDTVDLGILSSVKANAGQSQFAAGSNSPSGYAIYSLGTTMTSGNNIIAALTVPTASFPGNPQFGINLRANLSPPIGQDPVGLGIAAPTANYDTPNRFMYSDGDNIANASTSTNYNRMTVSYLVNIPSTQPVGVYSTTITYLITADF